VLVRDFNKFTYGWWRQEFLSALMPHQLESCDWSRSSWPDASILGVLQAFGVPLVVQF
jgi:hypothetical protein